MPYTESCDKITLKKYIRHFASHSGKGHLKLTAMDYLNISASKNSEPASTTIKQSDQPKCDKHKLT